MRRPCGKLRWLGRVSPDYGVRFGGTVRMRGPKRTAVSAAVVAWVLTLALCTGRSSAQEKYGSEWWNQYLTPGAGSVYEYPLIQGEFAEPGVTAELGFGLAAQESAYPSNRANAEAFRSYGYRFIPYAEGSGTSSVYLVHYTFQSGWAEVKHTHWSDWSSVTAADVTPPTGYLDYMDMWGFIKELAWVVGLPGKFPGVHTTPASQFGYSDADTAYPDGTPAVDREDFYTALAAKDWQGNVDFEDPPFAATSSLNATITPEVVALIPEFFPNPYPANPTGKHSILDFSKDTSAPVWQKYGNGIARFYCVDLLGDGVHYDNIGGWNTLPQSPKTRAFGDWSVHNFKTYLADHPGIYGGDPSTFDMRQYVQDTVSGGRSLASTDWLDDQLWRAYLLHKRDEIRAFTTGLHDYIKNMGTELGRDLAIMGNDLPFGVNASITARNLDAAGYEFSPHIGGGNHPFFGKGTMFPPYGRACAYYQTVNSQTAGRFNYPWYYVGETYMGMYNLSTVLFYEALANDSILIPNLTAASGAAGFTNRAGTVESVTDCNSFMKTAREIWGDRRRAANIAVCLSNQTQLAVLTPNMYDDWNHVQGVLGWNTYFTDRHYQYEVVQQENLDADYLSGVDLLVVPNCDVFGPAQVAVVDTWVTAGGNLIVTGDSGNRDDDEHNWDALASYSLAPLTTVSTPAGADDVARDHGAGRVVYTKANVGQTYYLDGDNYGTTQRTAGLATMDAAMADIGALPRTILTDTDASLLVGIRVFQDTIAGNVQVDLYNYDVSQFTDVLTPSGAVTVEVTLPPALSGQTVRAFLVSPDIAGYFEPIDPADITQVDDVVTVDVGSINLFKTLVLEADDGPPRVLVTNPLAADVVVAGEGSSISVDFDWDIVGAGAFSGFEYSFHAAGAPGTFGPLSAAARSLNQVVSADGHYAFEIRAVNGAPVKTAGPTTTRTFWTDNSAPVAEVTVGPAQGETIYLPAGKTILTVTMGYNAFDPSGLEQFEISIHATGSPGTLGPLWNPLQNSCGFGLGVGDWTLEVRATDTNGYVGPIATRDFHIAPTPPAPTAGFLATPTSGPAPLEVSFTNTSSGVIHSHWWDFGDTETSAETSPTHTYTTPNTYTVSLTVTGPGGTDTETKTDYIVVGPALPVNVVSPNGGETWYVGYSYDITWTTDGSFANAKIEYSTTGGSSWTTIVASTPNDGSHPWTIPPTPSTNCLVRISDAADGDPSDTSAGTFTIAEPLRVRLNGISWANDCTTAIVTFEANRAVHRYYYRLYQIQSTYSATSGTFAVFQGLGQGYYLVVVTAKDSSGAFAAEPARVWFYNKPTDDAFQVYIESYSIDDDSITFDLAATDPASIYYVRLYTTQACYTRCTGSVTYAGLADGLYYFVGTGRQAATGSFPTVGPARQFFCIENEGF